MPGRRHAEVNVDSEEDRSSEGGRGLTWWSNAACGVLLATIALPLFFDSLVSKFMMVSAAAAGTGLVFTMVAGAIVYFSSGKSRMAMNITVTIGAVVATASAIAIVTLTHSIAAKREEERIAKQVDDALQVIGLQWMRELETSGSARWTHSGDSTGEILEKAISVGGESIGAKLLRGCAPAMKEIAEIAGRREEAMNSLYNSGGLETAGLKAKADCDTRIAQLKAMGDASKEQLEAMRGFYEKASTALATVDVRQDVKSRFISRVQSDPMLNPAMQLREMDVEYCKHATAYVAYLKAGSGRWSAVTKDHTVYLGQGLNVGEFDRLSRAINDISDRQVSLQEREIKSTARKPAKGTRPEGKSKVPGTK